jgi:CCR4-NOT transcription complex subunit 6
MQSSAHTAPPDSSGDGTYYQMSLRTDRPIEGCELLPYPFLYLKGGNLDNAQRQKKMDLNPHTFTFRWFRGPRRKICQNEQCPRGGTFDPVYWCKHAMGGSSLRCATCEKAGVANHSSFFCSAACFKAGYKGHCHSQHASMSINDQRSLKRQFANRNYHSGEDLLAALADTDMIDTNHAIVIPEIFAAVENDWVASGIQKEYIPLADDVGCVLKVEVSALSSDGTVLAGPMISFTEPVLSAPRGPPKRQLVTIPSSSPASAVGTRFRVISYNILAELYATKQAYPYCDSWSLSWPYRRSMIQQELEEAQGDIVCLQEVQADHYEQHLNPFMQVYCLLLPP